MLKDPQLVYEKAEVMAEQFRKRVEQASLSIAEQAELNQPGMAGAAGAAPVAWPAEPAAAAGQPYVF